ncbi:class I SAM-dependent methyltransferase [Corynebacterium sp. H127]|uniref:class I SAM-dependent methyltransferase n=1 Tax=Corynebacterium sp. H127 TaxID=3133418 RepID=UPI0030A51673
MNQLHRTRALATLRRSWRLLRSFPMEQTRPQAFYSGLATDTFNLLDSLHRDISGTGLRGRRVLDVGGGPGYFASTFTAQGSHYLSVEPSATELHATGLPAKQSVRGDGLSLPFANCVFDLVYSSNVAEHVPQPWTMGEEMLRVAKPGGLVVLSYTVWLGPFGGHETGLWQHYIGGAWARDRYALKHGHAPKNVFGESLFDLSCAEGIRWAQSLKDAEVMALIPRYHPAWAWWLVRIPGLREFLVSNLVIVLRKTDPEQALP